MTLSGDLLTLDPLADVSQVTAATAVGSSAWVGGVDSTGAPLLLHVSSTGAEEVALPAGTTFIAAATMDGSVPWFAFVNASGGTIAHLDNGALIPAAVLDATPTALAVKGDQYTVAVSTARGPALLAGPSSSGGAKQQLPANDTIVSLTATSEGFAAAAQQMSDGVPDSTTFFVRATGGIWRQIPCPNLQTQSVVSAGATIYVSGSKADQGARVWSSTDQLTTLEPFGPVPAGESVYLLSAAGAAVWVLGEGIVVIS